MKNAPMAEILHVAHPGAIVLRTAAVYFALMIGLRLAGKRQLGQMTVFDLVVILVIANAVQNAMVGPDTSLTGGLLAAATLLLLNHAISAVRTRSRMVASWLGGTPTVIVRDGCFQPDALRKEHLGEAEVLMAMREHGVDRLAMVRQAVLETDGSISIVPVEEAHFEARRHVRFLRKSG